MTTTLLLLFYWSANISVLSPQGSVSAQEHVERGLHLAQAGDLSAAESELRRAVELAPHDPACLGNLGTILAMEKRVDESTEYLAKALAIDPHETAVRKNLAANLWQLHRLEEAKQNLEVILKENPHDQQAILLLGMVSENLKDYPRAAKLLASVKPLVWERAETVAALVRCYYRTQDKQQARQILKGLLESAADPQKVYLSGQTALEAEDYEIAAQLFASIRSSYPDPAKPAYYLALARYRTGRFSECQGTLLEIEAARRDSSVYELLGWCYAKQGALKEAIGAFERAIDLDPSQESAYLDLGSILVDHNMTAATLDLAKMAVQRLPESCRAHMMLGMTQARIGLLTDAVKSYTRAVELNPDSPEANYDLAMVQSIAGFTEAAMHTLEGGTKRFPRDAPQYEAYASFLVNRAEAGDAAAEARAASLLNSAISLDSSLPQAHYLLGRLELKSNKADEAARELELAAKLDPRSAKVHFALSRAYHRLGREEIAARELKVYEDFAKEELKKGRGRTGINLRRW
jgi:tetratricopeptide (TPR) repeat protein